MKNIEKKYFKFMVLGILSSKDKIIQEYNETLDSLTIKQYFIKNEKEMTEELFNEFQANDNWNNEIKRIASLATKERQDGFKGRAKFLNWYLEKEKVCCYCGVKEVDLKKYFNENNSQYVDARQRGKHLEIERVVTAPKERNIYSEDNTDLACYICNNAKSDFISPIDFKNIAKGIFEFWADRGAEIEFPENSSVWNKK